MKRVFCLWIALMLMLSVCAVPVFADSGAIYIAEPKGNICTLADIPPAGWYYVRTEFSFNGDMSVVESLGPIYLDTAIEDTGIISATYRCTTGVGNLQTAVEEFQLTMVYACQTDSFVFAFTEMPLEADDDRVHICVKLISHEPGYRFVREVGLMIGQVFGWVELVLEELMGGHLMSVLPLFAIGVAVPLVIVGIKIVRKFTWGA